MPDEVLKRSKRLSEGNEHFCECTMFTRVKEGLVEAAAEADKLVISKACHLINVIFRDKVMHYAREREGVREMRMVKMLPCSTCDDKCACARVD